MSYEQLNIVVKSSDAFRKFYLFKGSELRASAKYFQQNDSIGVSFKLKDSADQKYSNVSFETSFEDFLERLKKHKTISHEDSIDKIGLRLQVPSSRFLADQYIDDSVISFLESAKEYFPSMINHQLSTINSIKNILPNKPIIGLSDSSFHKTKPTKAWNYGIDLYLADNLDIKRFGYLGLSAEYIVNLLNYDLPERLIICYIGESGTGLTAVKNGKSVDSSMGYSTNGQGFSFSSSGYVDYSAVRKMKDNMGLSDYDMLLHLNIYSGLKGLSRNSSSISKVYEQAKQNNQEAKIAINTFVYGLQKQIGSMVASLGGLDCLVFTGSTGTSLPWLRKAIVKNLEYFGLLIDDTKNAKPLKNNQISEIHKRTRVNKILTTHSFDEIVMLKRLRRFN
jgi:acetate kinase